MAKRITVETYKTSLDHYKKVGDLLLRYSMERYIAHVDGPYGGWSMQVAEVKVPVARGLSYTHWKVDISHAVPWFDDQWKTKKTTQTFVEQDEAYRWLYKTLKNMMKEVGYEW